MILFIIILQLVLFILMFIEWYNPSKYYRAIIMLSSWLVALLFGITGHTILGLVHLFIGWIWFFIYKLKENEK